MPRLISRNEDKLLATMTDAQKERFIRYAEVGCFRTASDWEQKMMLAVMNESSGI